MFCITCGKQIAEDSLFCEHCGARQEGAAPGAPPGAAEQCAPAQAAPVQGNNPLPASPVVTPPVGGAAKKPMSPKTKSALIAIAAIAAVLVGAKLILGALFTPEKTVSQFMEALQAGDCDKLRSVASAEGVELTDEALAAFFTSYGAADSSAYAGLRDTLMRDALRLQQGAPAQSGQTVRLTEKSFVLFSVYKVEIIPVPVLFYSEFDNTKIQTAGQEIIAGPGSNTQMLMIPGRYSISASCTAPDTGVALHSDAADYVVNAAHSDVYVDFNYTYAYIEGSVYGLTLKEVQVDGRTYTGDLTDEDLYSGIAIGPVNYDSTVKVTATACGMDFVEEFDLSVEGEYCYIVPEIPEELRTAAIDIAVGAAPDWIRTVFSYDREALKRLKDSGAVSDGFLTALDEGLTTAWDSADEVFYIDIDSVSAAAEDCIVYENIGEMCTAEVWVPVDIRGTIGYMSLSSGEFSAGLNSEDASVPYDAVDPYMVNMVYENARWVITSVSLV